MPQWSRDEDDWITLNNDTYHRLAKQGTGIHRVKCFVNLGTELRHWPCFAYIREPVANDAKKNRAELKKYNHLYVEVMILDMILHPFFLFSFLIHSIFHPFPSLLAIEMPSKEYSTYRQNWIFPKGYMSNT